MVTLLAFELRGDDRDDVVEHHSDVQDGHGRRQLAPVLLGDEVHLDAPASHDEQGQERGQHHSDQHAASNRTIGGIYALNNPLAHLCDHTKYVDALEAVIYC